MKKICSLLLSMILIFSLPFTALASEESVSGGLSEIEKYGNVVFDFTSDKLTEKGYTYGDVLLITVDGKDFEVPFCTNYSDVNTGELVLRDSEGRLTLAINMGDFASTNGIAVKNKAEDGTVTWTVSDNRELSDVKVEVSLKEAEGYLSQYLIHQLVRTNNREDYSTDAVFANFRNIPFGALGENALFRSSSPVNNELNRAAYADAFAKENGINTVINLADSEAELEGYFAAEDFASPYYKSLYDAGKVKPLALGVDFTADDFKTSLAEGLRFMSVNEGPYLVHCNEGKDRAGFISALLSAYMGATYEELVADYMTTYENYYHVEKGSVEYSTVKESNIDSTLRTIASASKDTDLTTIDFASAAKAYIESIGLSASECEALRANLAANYNVKAKAETEASLSLYTVVAGDCLWSIAKKAYGNGNLWGNIYNANTKTIKNPGMIFEGQQIVIPM